ncbi:MAG TPA: DUF72 domain-containing protein [Burkholderiaceae bacterium]|nr:DUF72 domain-containing protein [Burkholderiaceae bacterium]
MADSLFDDDAAAPRVRAAEVDDAIVRLARQLPASVYLGTSSWSFPGWQGIVYGTEYNESQLARDGLRAYARHPLLRMVGIDRGYYQPLPVRELERYAQQVPETFRFLVKAPALVTDATHRGERGAPTEPNPHFLDAEVAAAQFVQPTLQGLGPCAGPLLFQLPPLPRELLAGDAGHATIDRIGAFLSALPRRVGAVEPLYAVELRNPELLTPRFIRMLRAAGVRLTIGVHARMPAAARQSAALRALDATEEEGDDWRLKGPLVVRWNLHSGLRYDDAKSRYAPFDRLIDADIATRGTLVHLVHVALKSGQPSYIVANNKAEGSAPLTLIELAKSIVG